MQDERGEGEGKKKRKTDGQVFKKITLVWTLRERQARVRSSNGEFINMHWALGEIYVAEFPFTAIRRVPISNFLDGSNGHFFAYLTLAIQLDNDKFVTT